MRLGEPESLVGTSLFATPRGIRRDTYRRVTRNTNTARVHCCQQTIFVTDKDISITIALAITSALSIGSRTRRANGLIPGVVCGQETLRDERRARQKKPKGEEKKKQRLLTTCRSRARLVLMLRWRTRTYELNRTTSDGTLNAEHTRRAHTHRDFFPSSF